jgi:gamma-glutamyltranspeptidase/glutathione hydrolase
MTVRLGMVAALVATASLTAQQPPRVAARRGETMRPQIRGTHGIVAAGRHYSVAAGVRMLDQGGNAIDAGVASVFAAAVCEISHFGFGGEVPTMI